MSAAGLEQAFASTRGVLANVKDDQMGDPTPCASWDVRGLVNHIIGGSMWFGSAMDAGGSEEDGSNLPDFTAQDYLAVYDEGARKAVEAFNRDGALEKMVKLPFGTFPGAAFLGLATTDVFTHGWDLAKATGQSTDLDAALAAQVLAGARAMGIDGFRGENGKAPFGPEQQAPAGACAADQLAAYLGRVV